MLTSDDIGAQTDAHVFGSIASSATKSTNQQSVISNEIIAENYRDLHSDNPALQLKATQQFRRFLSIGTNYLLTLCSIKRLFLMLNVERNPPIQQVIEAGVVPAFVIFLQRDDYPVCYPHLNAFYFISYPSTSRPCRLCNSRRPGH
jgi:hypothetical protein